MKQSVIISFIVIVATIASCSKSSSSGGSGTGGGLSCSLSVSFSANIKNILDANCATCHNPTTGSDATARSKWPYDGTYSSAFAKKDLISSLVGSGQMPKTGGLTQLVRDSVTCWVSKGVPN